VPDDPVAVRWAEHERTFCVELDRPPANALGRPLLDGLERALDDFGRSRARVLLLRSAVPGFFAAGADIKLMAGLDTAGFDRYGAALRQAVERVAALDRPSIAVVEGAALGGGLELALAASLRVGSAAARFGLPEPRLGLIAGAGGTQRLPRLVGRGRALDIMLTGRDVGAQEAFRIGLIDRLTAAGAAEAEGLALSGQIAAMSPAAITAILRGVDDAAELPLREGLAREAARETELFDRHDGQEGIAAFLDKRAPRFS
jgi:enoyl-CoA hydratase/carnithine racemase